MTCLYHFCFGNSSKRLICECSFRDRVLVAAIGFEPWKGFAVRPDLYQSSRELGGGAFLTGKVFVLAFIFPTKEVTLPHISEALASAVFGCALFERE